MEKKSYIVKEVIDSCKKDKSVLEHFIELVETNKDIKICSKCGGSGIYTDVSWEPALYTFSNFEIFGEDFKLNSKVCDMCKGLGIIEDNITLKGITR
jgi:DnaJ-class molecular chaperone